MEAIQAVGVIMKSRMTIATITWRPSNQLQDWIVTCTSRNTRIYIYTMPRVIMMITSILSLETFQGSNLSLKLTFFLTPNRHVFRSYPTYLESEPGPFNRTNYYSANNSNWSSNVAYVTRLTAAMCVRSSVNEIYKSDVPYVRARRSWLADLALDRIRSYSWKLQSRRQRVLLDCTYCLH